MAVLTEVTPQYSIVDKREPRYKSLQAAGEGEMADVVLSKDEELPKILTRHARGNFPIVEDSLKEKGLVIPEDWTGGNMLAFLAHVHIAAMDIRASSTPIQAPQIITLLIPDRFRHDILPESIVFRFKTDSSQYEGVFNISEPKNDAIGLMVRGTKDTVLGQSHIITDLSGSDLFNGSEFTDLGKAAVGIACDLFISSEFKDS